MTYEGKVAVVTGAARGIGRATAEALAAGGARVVVADLDREVVERTAAELPGETVAFAGNLVEERVAEALVDAAVGTWGRLDIVVNNAGYTADGPLHRMDDDTFRSMLEIHAVAPFRVLRAAAPHLREPAKREREEGREVFRKVVNVSSVAAWGGAGQAGYATGKAGVVGLTKTLAREWGPLKVNVNAVAFGLIDTRLTQTWGEESTVTIGERVVRVGVPARARADLDRAIPLGRAGTVAEAAAPIAFLCSPASDYVTGQVLAVSGGLAVGMSA
ncbi:SDR family NAD(P)-dependent oxidoreductase [Conexibacter arvalis]|uniref:3-oxoacyl-[acyl-carrier protein] reductase n=1 Tax=Conexibacter arvalis TaxID=912552 RepID=A0A840I934_9ACTN|nr:3-oxoacyl-[acyl-carrier protein] reductase [Conexibacter arvalis]